MSVPFVDLRAQHETLASEIADAWRPILERCDFVLGADVEAFEAELAEFCEVAHAVGVDSGTSAIELALRGLDVGPGDEVITAANTFVATALAIAHAGATPVLVDVDPDTSNLDPELVPAAITPRTKAIIPVHLYGQPADMTPLSDIAAEHGLWLVEDACQAHGARHRGRRTGSLGHAGAFSFYPGKNLGCYGDGGAVVTNDDRLADRLRMLRNYGQRRKYHHETRGFNRRLDTLQAAVLRVKLRRLDGWNARRREHASLLRELLSDSGLDLPAVAPDIEAVWHLFVVQTARRDELAAHLSARGIATGIHYPIPLHLQPCLKDLGYRPGDFPVTELQAGRILSLPMFPELSRDAIEQIADAVLEFTPAESAGTVEVA